MHFYKSVADDKGSDNPHSKQEHREDKREHKESE